LGKPLSVWRGWPWCPDSDLTGEFVVKGGRGLGSWLVVVDSWAVVFYPGRLVSGGRWACRVNTTVGHVLHIQLD